jgi:hypothetical protein
MIPPFPSLRFTTFDSHGWHYRHCVTSLTVVSVHELVVVVVVVVFSSSSACATGIMQANISTASTVLMVVSEVFELVV